MNIFEIRNNQKPSMYSTVYKQKVSDSKRYREKNLEQTKEIINIK